MRASKPAGANAIDYVLLPSADLMKRFPLSRTEQIGTLSIELDRTKGRAARSKIKGEIARLVGESLHEHRSVYNAHDI